jgi:hypothetical protein
MQVQNARTVGRSGANAVYIGRPTKWGNPFVMGRDGNRVEVILKYEKWICDQPNLLADLHELTGKNLICWCAPDPCHGDILLKLANSAG